MVNLVNIIPSKHQHCNCHFEHVRILTIACGAKRRYAEAQPRVLVWPAGSHYCCETQQLHCSVINGGILFIRSIYLRPKEYSKSKYFAWIQSYLYVKLKITFNFFYL